ncbi:MAG: DNA-processing protein DprA [Pseudomonadota bacterium]
MLATDPTPTPAAPSHRDVLLDWLRLAHTPGLGASVAHGLLDALGSPQRIFSSSYTELAVHLTPQLARILSAPAAPPLLALAAATRAWLGAPARLLLDCRDSLYPEALRHIPVPPLLLYASGRIELLGAESLAIVGSRNASAQGRENAASFATALGDCGLTIVSGLALGIDAAAHRGGLASAASTVAVVGTGIDRVYPAANRALAQSIAERGCIVSEYALGTPAAAYNFPRRNRIISGLTRGVLVVEAAAQSGSLSTAHLAAEQGREVFAIPGSIHSALSKGCHQLIKDGAALVESAADILHAFGHALPAHQGGAREHQGGARAAPAAPLDPALVAVLEALGHDPANADTLCARTGIDPGALCGALLALELGGHIERLPGALVRRLRH